MEHAGESEHLDRAATEVLAHSPRAHAFFPMLEEAERTPRLALAYRRDDGSARAIVGAAAADAFVHELLLWTSEKPPRAGTAAPRPPPRTTLTEAGTEVLSRLDSVETRSGRFAPTLDKLARVAETELSVIFLGESGTGKEHLARAIHGISPRSRGPFVAVNCSAIADELIESELFGHTRGAFTAAQKDRAGAFGAADGGTLLLDEIGDAPLRVQLALLRALENKAIRPVGSDSDRTVNVRVLAATSRDLHELIEQRAFRKDLYYRLAELTVELPPLRDRREDIAALSALLLGGLAPGVSVSNQAEAVLVQHDWPGNVRELRNSLKRAVALSCGAAVLQAVHFSELGEAEPTLLRTTAETEPPRVRLSFPPHVMRRAEEIWSAGSHCSAAARSYEQRALDRNFASTITAYLDGLVLAKTRGSFQ